MTSALPFLFIFQFSILFAGVGLSNPSDPVQPPHCRESESLHTCASRLLDSRDAVECAWGAYLAGEHRFKDLQPKLEILLKRVPAVYSDSSLFRVALDAAIKMGALLPEKILVSMPERYAVEQTILLARNSEKYSESILSVFRKLHVCLQWQALGNMLLKVKARGFPHVLMQDLKRIDINLSVTDPAIGAGMGGSVGWGVSGLINPSDFPPLGTYSLTDYDTSSAVEMFPGPHVVYAMRREHSPGYCVQLSGMHHHKPDNWDPNTLRMEFLAAFLGLPEDDIKFSRRFEVSWSGPERFIEDIRLHCSRIVEKYDRIVSILQKRDLIEPKEAEELVCNIHLRIFDQREDRRTLLPTINLNRVAIE